MTEFSIFADLNEGKMLPSKQHWGKYNARDIADFVFLNILTLEILRHEGLTHSFAESYAQSTLSKANFNMFIPSCNDLCTMMFILYKKDGSSLKDPFASQKLLDNFYLDLQSFKKYLSMVANRDFTTYERRFLLQVENDLHITTTNYKSIRRLVQDWEELDHEEKSLVITRLLQAYSAKMQSGELYTALNSIAKSQNLLINNVYNPETGNYDKKSSGGLFKTLALGSLAALAGFTYGVVKNNKDKR